MKTLILSIILAFSGCSSSINEIEIALNELKKANDRLVIVSFEHGYLQGVNNTIDNYNNGLPLFLNNQLIAAIDSFQIKHIKREQYENTN